MVLKEFKLARRSCDTCLIDLMLVCKRWHEIIAQSPQLWCHLEAPIPRRIAKLILARSQPYPLNVDWSLSYLVKRPARDDLESLVEVVAEHSNRISRLDVEVPSFSAAHIRTLLEAPTTTLESLRVRVEGHGSDSDDEEGLERFDLSEGLPIKYLNLDDVSTPLDTPRLSNLLTLALSHSAVPFSPQRLLQTLSGMQTLEYLSIYSAPELLESPRKSSTWVTLPRLKTLSLFNVPTFYNASLLTHIYTPACDQIVLYDKASWSLTGVSESVLDDGLWDLQNKQTTVLLGGTKYALAQKSLEISLSDRTVTITSPRDTRDRINLTFTRINTRSLRNGLARAVSQMPLGLPISLQLLAGSFSPTDPLDLTPWNERLESIYAHGANQCRDVMQQLLRRRGVQVAGRNEWVCQRLSEIRLVYTDEDEETPALDGEALLELARQRWSTEGCSALATPPSLFRVRCLASRFPHMWSVEAEARKILPEFELIEDLSEVQ
ncbi:hypothetical protein FRB90_010530 [Tulasnella sp. 427]|nr:hypothetical protein FRB90_010530 [Tulasnella sp. 427]